MNVAMTGATPEDAGLASGLVNTTAQVGGALGLAVLATLVGVAHARADARGEPRHAAALTGGYHLAFWIAAALVGVRDRRRRCWRCRDARPQPGDAAGAQAAEAARRRAGGCRAARCLRIQAPGRRYRGVAAGRRRPRSALKLRGSDLPTKVACAPRAFQRLIGRLSLTRQVALLSLLPMIALGLILARVLQSQVVDRTLADATRSARIIARLGVQPRLTPRQPARRADAARDPRARRPS